MSSRWYESRVFRLLATLFLANGLVVFAELLLVLGLFIWINSQRTPPNRWLEMTPTVATYGVFVGQLLFLSLVGSLVEKTRWRVWLAAMPFTFLLAVGFVSCQIGPDLRIAIIVRSMLAVQVLSVGVVVGSFLPIILCYGSLLLASVLIWPLRVMAGWRVAWAADPIGTARSAPISQLMLWIGLWAALFLLAIHSTERFGRDGIFFALIGGFVILFTGLPVVYLASGAGRTLARWCLIAAYLVLLSYGESEVIYRAIKPSGFTTVGRVLVMVLAFNIPVVGVVAMNCLLVRGLGLRLDMPLFGWLTKRPTEASPVGRSMNTRIWAVAASWLRA